MVSKNLIKMTIKSPSDNSYVFYARIWKDKKKYGKWNDNRLTAFNASCINA